MPHTRHCCWIVLLLALGCGRSAPIGPGGGPVQTGKDPYEIDLSGTAVSPIEQAPADTIGLCFCLDVSPSMNERIDGRPKLEISKQAMRKTFEQLSAYAQEHPQKKLLVGLVAFGGEARLVQKLEPFNPGRLEQAIKNLGTVPGTGVGNGLLLGLKVVLQTPLETRCSW